MSYKVNLVVLVLGILVVACHGKPKPGGKAADHPHAPGQLRMPPIKCAGTDLKFPTKLRDAIYSCLNKTVASLKEKGTKEIKDMKALKDCQWVCVSQELGILDKSGMLVKDQMDTIIEDTFPENKVDEIVSGFGTCAMDHSSSFVLKEGDCTSYGEFIDCGIKKVFETCEIDMPNFVNNS